MIALVFDCETGGLVHHDRPPEDPTQPHLLQLAHALIDVSNGKLLRVSSEYVYHDDPVISPQAAAVNGITRETVMRFGCMPDSVLQGFFAATQHADVLVGHNYNFDELVMRCYATKNMQSEHARLTLGEFDQRRTHGRFVCTMLANEAIVQAKTHAGKSKFPKLSETFAYYFGQPHEGQHDALGDVLACARVLVEMEKRKAVGDVLPSHS